MYLVIQRHHENSTDSDQVLHVVLMFRWTGSSTVKTIVESTVWTEQQAVAAGEHWLTKLKLIKRIGRLSEPIKPSEGVVDNILVVLHAMVHSIWS